MISIGGLLEMETPLIVSSVRTPIGKFGRSLKDIPAPRLGALVVREVLRRAKVESNGVDEVIIGNVLGAGLGQNPARQAAIYAGVPSNVGAVTVNKVCGSGLKAVMLAAQAIKAGDANLVVAGGMENMSNSPYLVRGARWGIKYGDRSFVDSMIFDGLWDVYNDFHMIMTGEAIAEKFGISREEADQFAYESHMKALRATEKGEFQEEIVQVDTLDGTVLGVDEGIRPDTSIEKLSKLPPVIKKDGVVTAGNASQLSDGASALVVMSESRADELGLRAQAKIKDYVTGGVDPKWVMEAPIPTVRALLDRANMTVEDVDLFEHNEAYATASIAVRRELRVPEDRFNIRGGAVAMGHPIGCSGARVLTTLIHALRQKGKRTGLATLCLGGGNAVAMIVESIG